MNVYILHGAGESAILKKIDLIKKDFDPLSIFTLNVKNVKDLRSLAEISSSGLFIERRLIILDDIDEDANLENLPEDENLTIVFKFSKALPARSRLLSLRRKSVVVFFSPEEREVSIFPFLDEVNEKNPKALGKIEGFYNQYGGQYILTMLYYSMRRLILPLKTKNAFVLSKLDKLKKNFSREKMLKFYFEILETDNKVKLGLLDEKLAVKRLILRLVNL